MVTVAWKEAFARKLHADRTFDRVLKEENIQLLLPSMELCDQAEWNLILIERKIRDEKVLTFCRKIV